MKKQPFDYTFARAVAIADLSSSSVVAVAALVRRLSNAATATTLDELKTAIANALANV